MYGKGPVSALFILTLCASSGWEISAIAEESLSFSPAKFVEGEKSLRNLIRFPKVDRNLMVLLTCYGEVSARGRISRNRCSSAKDPDLVFSRAVETAARGARLSPAMLNGKNKKVWLQFTVIFLKNGETEDVGVYHNIRNNLSKYGLHYIGAQRIALREFPKTCRTNRDWFALGRITIAIDSSPRDFELDPESKNIPLGCHDSIKNRMLTAKYIPAFHQGMPVESIYSEPWFYHYGFYLTVIACFFEIANPEVLCVT